MRIRQTAPVLLLGMLLLPAVPLVYAAPIPPMPHAVLLAEASPPPPPPSTILHSGSPRPIDGGGIDPLLWRDAEPAPMGITDFGVNASLYPYSYSTNEFVGTISVSNLLADDAQSGNEVSFQLNVFLLLYNASTSPPTYYDIWVQNTIGVTTGLPGGDQWNIESNIWNISGPGSSFNTSDIEGNGSFFSGGGVYYSCAPNCSGEFGPLVYPSTLGVRVDSVDVRGEPEVALDYLNGTAWQNYDTVKFPNAGRTNMTDDGFYVTGTGYGPGGLPQDAEWIYASIGGGATQVDRGSVFNMSLEYWNGHNLEAPPAAWNFGVDTAETVGNLSATPVTLLGGSPGVGIVGGTSGALGPLYDNTDVGTLVVEDGHPNGTILIDGAPTPYVNGSATLVLDPGTYAVRLQGSPTVGGTAVIRADATTRLDLAPLTATTFVESGLPSWTEWSVTLGNVTDSTTGGSLTFDLANGTYVVNYSLISGYVLATAPAQITVPAAGPIPVTWVPFRFSVPFTESGLPPGTPWWVNVSGLVFQGTAPTLEAGAPNGTDLYTAGALYEFVADPPNGTLTVVAGRVSPITVSFGYRPTFIVGSIVPTDATLTIDGTPEPLARNGTFNDSVVPGTYTLVATAPGFIDQTLDLNATAGNVTIIHLELNQSVAANPPPSKLTASSPIPWTELGVLAAVLLAAVGVVAFMAVRRRRR
jgi:Thermopsin